jgi:2-phosphosulfolactate phosphatase
MTGTVEVFFLPHETDDSTFAGKSAVVVDLLRASTTIVTALDHGAREVVPIAAPERAVSLRDDLGKAAVKLCGERNGEMIPGFDLGNSPREYTREAVADKILLFASSNGSAAFLAASPARRMAVGALVNATAVVDWVCQEDLDCVILCAGKLGQFSLEDAACAGYFVRALARRGFVPANDAAIVALLAHMSVANDWQTFLEKTDHGRYLAGLGFGADFPIVAAIDSVPLVPVWAGNKIVRAVHPVVA